MTPHSFYAPSVLGIMDPCLAQIRMLSFVDIIPVETNLHGRKSSRFDACWPPRQPLRATRAFPYMANTTQNIMADKILFMGWPLPHCTLLSATMNENQ